MVWTPDFTQPPPKVQTLAEAQALIEALWEIARQVEGLKAQVAELQEQVALSSRNSSQPPSQDGPGAPRPAPKKSGRPRGGQKGHPGYYRALVPSHASIPQQAVREAQAVHSDETSRRYRNERRWLWVAFCTTVSRGQAEAKALLR